MGWIKNRRNKKLIKLAGEEVRKSIQEAKNQQVTPNLPTGVRIIVNCLWCGAPLKFDKKNNRYKWINCQGKLHWLRKGIILCEKCAKRCKKCGRNYCPKHIEKHKCIK